MPPVVEARALQKHFGSRVAVAGLDLEVPQGQCYGLLGPNGAGKTTSLRMVYGVARPTSGELRVFGLDITREGRRIRARLGVTLQDNVFIESLTPVENLQVFGRYHLLAEAELKRRVDELVVDLDLASHADVPAGRLSGGYKRRMAIAMALMNSPELLILDEPTTGLDPAVRLSLWNKVRELRARGTTVLLTTHYMDEAERLCDRVLIMSQGKAVCEGVPRELIRARLGREVLELDASPAEEQQLLHRAPALRALRSGPRVFFFGEDAQHLVEHVQSTPALAQRPFVLRPTNLEDLFIAETGTGLEAATE